MSYQLLRFLGTVTAIALFLHGDDALAASPAPSARPGKAPSSQDSRTLETITVEARRELERRVSHYISTVVVHPFYNSLARWTVPICPLVAGLTPERGEFILWRISQIATAANAPLAGEHCKANLYVVVTSEPKMLMEKWRRRDPKLLDTTYGMGHIDRFLRASHPIRSWYNTGFTPGKGGTTYPEAGAAGLQTMRVPTTTSPEVTRLRYSAVRSLSSVIVVVDANQTHSLDIGQLADYVAMAGLAEIVVDADLGTAPSILRLFQASDNPPRGLSAWDQAFLQSLYNTSQANVQQSSSIHASMLEKISPP